MDKDRGKCPSCESDMNGEPIWRLFYDRCRKDGYWDKRGPMTHEEAEVEADRISEMYGADRTRGVFGRAIGLSDGDSVRASKCPDCGHEWTRK